MERRPFEYAPEDLPAYLEDAVNTVFTDLQSQFLVLPKGPNFVEYAEFQTAYEVLKRATQAFQQISLETLWEALRADSRSLLVLRTILGLTPPEWADLARSDLSADVPQGAARSLDARARRDAGYLAAVSRRLSKTRNRVDALIGVAIRYLDEGAPAGAADTVHRLAKIDTSEGLESLQFAASQHVPYAVVLYERYLGRPFASHRDSVSELIGEVMETAIEERLNKAGITFRRTGRAERVPGYEQAPDFFVPDEVNPSVLIEAKITGDDGTARDKVARILRLTTIRDRWIREGRAPFEVVACIDGRGFGIRREDMRQMLTATEGKVFTLNTLDELIPRTRLSYFASIGRGAPDPVSNDQTQ